MKTKRRGSGDVMRAEYELDYRTAVRGKYHRQLVKKGANVIVLEADVAQVFRTSKAVNEALRMLLQVSDSVRRLTVRSARPARPARPSRLRGSRHGDRSD